MMVGVVTGAVILDVILYESSHVSGDRKLIVCGHGTTCHNRAHVTPINARINTPYLLVRVSAPLLESSSLDQRRGG